MADIVPIGYKLIDSPERISAVDGQGHEICGAYSSAGHECWNLFVTSTVTEITGLHTSPHHEHFWGRSGHDDANRWIELIATLYVMAMRGK